MAVLTPMSGDGVVPNDLVSRSQVNIFLILFNPVDFVTVEGIFTRWADTQVKDLTICH